MPTISTLLLPESAVGGGDGPAAGPIIKEDGAADVLAQLLQLHLKDVVGAPVGFAPRDAVVLCLDIV